MARIQFDSYTPVSPSYVGPVAIELAGSGVRLQTRRQVATGFDHQLTATLAEPLPSIVQVEDGSEESARRQWNAMSSDARDYYQEPAYIEPAKLKWLQFADGSEGAILLGGEVCIVSFYVLDGSGAAREQVLEFRQASADGAETNAAGAEAC